MLAGVALVGAGARLAAAHPAAVAQQVVQTSASPAPATSPPDQPTPLVVVPTDTPTPTATPSPTPSPRVSPTPSSGTVTVLTRQIQVHRPGRATLSASTTPGSLCQIAVGYSPAPQLSPATANASGAVGWTWRVGDQVGPGTYPIQVTCGGAAAGATITVS